MPPSRDDLDALYLFFAALSFITDTQCEDARLCAMNAGRLSVSKSTGKSVVRDLGNWVLRQLIEDLQDIVVKKYAQMSPEQIQASTPPTMSFALKRVHEHKDTFFPPHRAPDLYRQPLALAVQMYAEGVVSAGVLDLYFEMCTTHARNAGFSDPFMFHLARAQSFLTRYKRMMATPEP